MKQTKDIIKQMEKEFNKKFERYHYGEDGDSCAYYNGEPCDCSVADYLNFFRTYIRTLLESFGEEIIGEDETEANQIERDKQLEVQTYYVITANMRRRNQLRAEQRLKMKEIISSLEK